MWNFKIINVQILELSYYALMNIKWDVWLNNVKICEVYRVILTLLWKIFFYWLTSNFKLPSVHAFGANSILWKAKMCKSALEWE